MNGIDIARCRKGMAQLAVEGRPRPALIEEVITMIQRDPADALTKYYLGIKNYAAFGDQREDHGYGFGPKHGSIVFRIGRTDDARARTLDDDAIYYLEAYRDFPAVRWTGADRREYDLYLGEAVREFDRLTARRNKLADAFEVVTLDAHSSEVKS